jgi:hypothetical protein
MMPDWLVAILTGLLPAIVVALVTSAITVTLALRRFRQERWWDRKATMYGELLETLHGLKRYTESYIERYQTDLDDKEKLAEIDRIWKECSAKLSRLEDLASFQLSERAVSILEEYRKEKAAARHEDTYQWAEGDLLAVEHCLEKLKREAKRDLRIR